jgi:hypothetical protein
VIRRVQSSGHEDSWVPARRDAPSFLAQSGTLTGLTDLRPGLVLDLNPEATAKIDGANDGRDWRYDAGAPELGGNVRWGVTPNLTLNGTINPDFSHVEADAGQFQFDPRSAVFFAEKRPFFLDNIEQFSTPNNLIYTRRIVDPLFAVKLTGKLAGMAVAALSAVDSRASGGGDRPIFNILRVQRDLGAQSRAAIVYTDRVAGDDSNRVLGGDARLVFGDLSLLLQGAVSRTNSGGDVKHAPLWQAALTRNGRYFGLRYSLRGIDPDFRAASGFVNRAGIAQAIFTNQLSLYGKPKALLEKWTGDVTLDGIWQYRNFTSRGPIQDKKLHLNNNFILKRGWRVGASLLIETFGYDEELYADYVLVREDAAGAVHYLPFTGVPSLPNVDYVITLDTPRVGGVSFNLFSLWGKDENFHEWSSANIAYLQTSAEWRPTERLRVDAGYQLQTFNRRTDGTNVARRRIPRLKVEYQVTRAIFLRVVGEYDAREQDALRDDSRTELPIAIRDPITGQYVRALARSDNLFRVDWLFSYQPNPGTVIFAGYGSTLTEPSSLRLRDLTRTSDGFFLKVSYLFRL